MLTHEQYQRYQNDGYVIIPGLLNREETAFFRDTAREDLRRQAEAGETVAKGAAHESSRGSLCRTLWHMPCHKQVA